MSHTRPEPRPKSLPEKTPKSLHVEVTLIGPEGISAASKQELETSKPESVARDIGRIYSPIETSHLSEQNQLKQICQEYFSTEPGWAISAHSFANRVAKLEALIRLSTDETKSEKNSLKAKSDGGTVYLSLNDLAGNKRYHTTSDEIIGLTVTEQCHFYELAFHLIPDREKWHLLCPKGLNLAITSTTDMVASTPETPEPIPSLLTSIKQFFHPPIVEETNGRGPLKEFICSKTAIKKIEAWSNLVNNKKNSKKHPKQLCTDTAREKLDAILSGKGSPELYELHRIENLQNTTAELSIDLKHTIAEEIAKQAKQTPESKTQENEEAKQSDTLQVLVDEITTLATENIHRRAEEAIDEAIRAIAQEEIAQIEADHAHRQSRRVQANQLRQTLHISYDALIYTPVLAQELGETLAFYNFYLKYAKKVVLPLVSNQSSVISNPAIQIGLLADLEQFLKRPPSEIKYQQLQTSYQTWLSDVSSMLINGTFNAPLVLEIINALREDYKLQHDAFQQLLTEELPLHRIRVLFEALKTQLQKLDWSGALKEYLIELEKQKPALKSQKLRDERNNAIKFINDFIQKYQAFIDTKNAGNIRKEINAFARFINETKIQIELEGKILSTKNIRQLIPRNAKESGIQTLIYINLVEIHAVLNHLQEMPTQSYLDIEDRTITPMRNWGTSIEEMQEHLETICNTVGNIKYDINNRLVLITLLTATQNSISNFDKGIHSNYLYHQPLNKIDALREHLSAITNGKEADEETSTAVNKLIDQLRQENNHFFIELIPALVSQQQFRNNWRDSSIQIKFSTALICLHAEETKNLSHISPDTTKNLEGEKIFSLALNNYHLSKLTGDFHSCFDKLTSITINKALEQKYFETNIHRFILTCIAHQFFYVMPSDEALSKPPKLSLLISTNIVINFFFKNCEDKSNQDKLLQGCATFTEAFDKFRQACDNSDNHAERIRQDTGKELFPAMEAFFQELGNTHIPELSLAMTAIVSLNLLVCLPFNCNKEQSIEIQQLTLKAIYNLCQHYQGLEATDTNCIKVYDHITNTLQNHFENNKPASTATLYSHRHHHLLFSDIVDTTLSILNDTKQYTKVKSYLYHCKRYSITHTGEAIYFDFSLAFFDINQALEKLAQWLNPEETQEQDVQYAINKTTDTLAFFLILMEMLCSSVPEHQVTFDPSTNRQELLTQALDGCLVSINSLIAEAEDSTKKDGIFFKYVKSKKKPGANIKKTESQYQTKAAERAAIFNYNVALICTHIGSYIETQLDAEFPLIVRDALDESIGIYEFNSATLITILYQAFSELKSTAAQNLLQDKIFTLYNVDINQYTAEMLDVLISTNTEGVMPTNPDTDTATKTNTKTKAYKENLRNQLTPPSRTSSSIATRLSFSEEDLAIEEPVTYGESILYSEYATILLDEEAKQVFIHIKPGGPLAEEHVSTQQVFHWLFHSLVTFARNLPDTEKQPVYQITAAVQNPQTGSIELVSFTHNTATKTLSANYADFMTTAIRLNEIHGKTYEQGLTKKAGAAEELYKLFHHQYIDMATAHINTADPFIRHSYETLLKTMQDRLASELFTLEKAHLRKPGDVLVICLIYSCATKLANEQTKTQIKPFNQVSTDTKKSGLATVSPLVFLEANQETVRNLSFLHYIGFSAFCQSTRDKSFEQTQELRTFQQDLINHLNKPIIPLRDVYIFTEKYSNANYLDMAVKGAIQKVHNTIKDEPGIKPSNTTGKRVSSRNRGTQATLQAKNSTEKTLGFVYSGNNQALIFSQGLAAFFSTKFTSSSTADEKKRSESGSSTSSRVGSSFSSVLNFGARKNS